ncbi:hypothetical protein LCGC14_0484110, partial [marine sediment metagenome]|nr:autotransporter domain-containing protein [Methylophaga aminisulfidivorans]
MKIKIFILYQLIVPRWKYTYKYKIKLSYKPQKDFETVMNKAYKVIWSVSRQAWVIVGELTKGKSKSSAATSVNKLTHTISTGLLASGLSLIAIPALAAPDFYWSTTTGDWFTEGNWSSNLVPTSSSGATFIDNGGTAQITSGTAQAQYLYVGNVSAGSIAISNGGSLSVADTYIGFDPGSTGIVTVDGSGSSLNSDILYLGYYPSSNGSLVISNNGVVSVNSGAGILNITSGNFNSTATLSIGAASGDTAVEAGTLSASTVRFGNGAGSLIFNHTNTAYDFAPNISGTGTIKLLAGSTHFSGDLSTYNAGTLTVDGGTLAIHSGDTLSLNGDYTQTTDGHLSIGVADDSTFGKLAVAGTATLANNAKININVTDPNFSFTTTNMVNIISAYTLVSDGTFAVTDNSLLFDFGAVKNGNAVDLTLAAATSAKTVTSSAMRQAKPAALGAAKAIDAVIASNPSSTLATNFVSLTTEREVANAIESSLPGVSGGMAQLTNTATGAMTAVVSSRQDTQQGLSSGDEFMTDRHIWFKPFGGWTKQDLRQSVSGYDIDSYGLAMGVDGDVSSAWNVGAAFAYINSDVESNLAAGAQTIDMNSYLAKVYATMTLDATTALNLQAGFGISDYDSNRRIFNGDVANANYDSWNSQLSA